MNVKNMTKVALCIALLCVSSYIVIPLPFTPAVLSAQTIVVNLVALILTPAQAFAAIGGYLALGLCGLPVFSAGTAGIGKILGPTGGFYIGFLVAVVAISLLKGNANRLRRFVPVTILVGMPIIYFFATLFMCIFQQVSVPAALMTAVVPFIAGDILKCAAASSLAVVLNKALSRQRVA